MPKSAERAPARRKLVSIRQVAEDYSMSPRTVRLWVAQGKLTAYVVGTRTIRLDPDEVERLFSVRLPTAAS